jgi:hypothetical protein
MCSPSWTCTRSRSRAAWAKAIASFRGVAGSGKTLILAFRAEYLARASLKPVLILCYANGIAGRLEDVMQERGIEDRVQVCTFHSWCHQMLKTYGIPGPNPKVEVRSACTVTP